MVNGSAPVEGMGPGRSASVFATAVIEAYFRNECLVKKDMVLVMRARDNLRGQSHCLPDKIDRRFIIITMSHCRFGRVTVEGAYSQGRTLGPASAGAGNYRFVTRLVSVRIKGIRPLPLTSVHPDYRRSRMLGKVKHFILQLARLLVGIVGK